MNSKQPRFNVFRFFKDLRCASNPSTIQTILTRNPVKEENWDKVFGINAANTLRRKTNWARNGRKIKAKKKLATKGLLPFAYDVSITMATHVKEYFGLEYDQYLLLTKKGCSICKRKKNIHLHHIIPKSQGGSNEISNLTSLCVNCHQKQHKHDISANTSLKQ